MFSALPSTGVPPVLDFSDFYSPDPQTRSTLLHALHTASLTSGFFQLTNHPISPLLQSRILRASKSFFSLPISEKIKLDKSNNTWNRGYEPLGGQMLEPGTKPDLKESFFVGEEIAEDHEDCVKRVYNRGPNFWPRVERVGEMGVEEFREVCGTYYGEIYKLAQTVFEALALALGLESDWFEEFTRDAVGTLRLIHYPPSENTDPKERGVGAHKDFGAVTLLMQDEVGGLQVMNEATGEWVDVPPIPNAFVVNLGNVMPRWTNDKYKSALHRVINRSGTDRYSIPFFFTGNVNYVLTCIPGCEDQELSEDGSMVTAKKASRYEPISVGEFVTQQNVESYRRVKEYQVEGEKSA